MRHPWLSGENATDHNLLPEIKSYMAKAKLRRGIELVKLANRIEALKQQEEDPENSDVPDDATLAADQSKVNSPVVTGPGKRSLSKTIKGAIFREVVLAKVREMKHQAESLKVQEEAEKEARRKSFQG
jgi:calcium/calmodulin-dependent protein kinase I